MESIVLEWLNLLGRWIHVIAAIMWIGDSFLFMWMDKSLVPPTRPRDGAVTGELWMVHSGGFYELVKRRYLAPNEMPADLHWFKWEAYTTWLSGFFMLAVVYYLGGAAYLVDPQVARFGVGAAVAVSIGLLVLAWLLYDAIWNSVLAARPAVAAGVCFALIAVAAYGLTRVYSGRGAYLQLGAMLGTIMAANVWRVIVPGQNRMLAATRAGTPVDVSHGVKAKTRSTHNHYLTLPVLFTMMSNHFPSTYGHHWNWLVLILIMVFGAAAKYVMNFRGRSNPWIAAAGAAALVTVVTLTVNASAPRADAAGYRGLPPVPFATARAIIDTRCVTCHAAHPTSPSFPQAPGGVMLDEPARIRTLAPRILQRAVITKTMPLGNLTGITEEERRTLGAWIAQGAHTDEGAPR